MTILNAFRRLWFLLTSSRREAELREEIELHRALAQERLEADGLSPEEAYYASQRSMGNATLAREDARGTWTWSWIDGVRQDVGYALRLVRRAPAFAAAMIVISGLGIGATTCVFGLVDDLMLKPLPVPAAEELVWFRDPAFSYPVFTEVRARSSQVLSGLAAWNLDRLNVQWGRDVEPEDVLTASGEFFGTLRIHAAVGRTLGPSDDAAGGGGEGLVAVISDACWERRFHRDPAIVGRTVRIEQQLFTVVGVTPRGFFGVAPGLAPELTIPLTSLQSAARLDEPFRSWVHLMGRRRDGVSLAQANAALAVFWPAVLEATTNSDMPDDRRAMYLGRTTAIENGRAGYSRVRNQYAQPLWVLLALVSTLSVVSCASSANLLLARGVGRRREMAVRLAIGAGRWRLARQMLTEAVVWTAMGAGAGTIVAVWGEAALVRMMSTWEEHIVIDVQPDWRIAAFAAALAFVTAIVATVAPALRATRVDPGTTLKTAGASAALFPRRWGLGQSLVTIQIALTVLLLAGAMLLGRSLYRVLSQDAGFDRRNLLVVGTDPGAAGYRGEQVRAFYAQFLDRLRALPGVESASLSWYPPISDEDGAWTQSVATDGNVVRQDPSRAIHFNAISPGYFRTLRVSLVRGRDFAPSDRDGAPRVAIVNESVARLLFAGGDPIGHRITIGRNRNRRELEIVGLVTDAKYRRLEVPAPPTAYLACDQLTELTEGASLFAEIRIGEASRPIAERVRAEARALIPNLPVRLQTLEDRIGESLVTRRITALLSAVLGVTALALASAALFGLLSYSVSSRAREMGLRLALGATPAALMHAVLRDGLIVSVAGVALGLGATAAVSRYLSSLLFQISVVDPLSLAAAGAGMLLVSAICGLVPARRAARVDPIVTLRGE